MVFIRTCATVPCLALMVLFLCGSIVSAQSTDAEFLDSYPVRGAPGFDSRNRGYFRAGTQILIKSDEVVEAVGFGESVRTAVDRDIFPDNQKWDGKWDESSRVDNSIVFDDSDIAYTVITPRRSNLKNAVLLYSTDLARSWKAVRLKGITATIELRDGFNSSSAPPTVLSYENYASFRGGKLWLETFRYDDGRVRRAMPPQLVTDQSLLAQKHSGGGNSTFTRDGKIFIVYPSAVPPTSGSGTMSFIRAFDTREGRFTSGEILLGTSASTEKDGPDEHDIPVITANHVGTLTVLIGGHHSPLLITESKSPLSVSRGWTHPRPIGNNTDHQSFTYASVNTLPDQSLNIFMRHEDQNYRFSLVHFWRPSGGVFRTWDDGRTYRVIVQPVRRFYAVWRHRATMDQEGNLYLNYQYEPNQLTADEVRAIGVDPATAEHCRNGRCFYRVRPLTAATLVSRDGQAFHRYDID